MRIVDLRETRADGWKSALATIIWEKRDKPAQDIYFATPEDTGDMLTVSPEAFLLAASHAASYHFEPRVTIEGRVCPLFADGLTRALDLVSRRLKDAPPAKIDVETTDVPKQPAPGAVAALAYSGGVDSLASLYDNRAQHQPGDHDYLRLGLVLASGFDPLQILPGTHFWDNLAAMAEAADLRPVAVKANARDLEPADHFFGYRLYGAYLASLGHALGNGVRSLAIASGGVLDIRHPEGSDPDLDPLYSSGAVEIIHDMVEVGRFDKTRLIADQPAVRDRLKVCLVANRLESGKLNCGRCEKCLRTMLTLLAMGSLGEFGAFDRDDVTPQDLEEGLHIPASILSYYYRIADELEGIGRHDLVVVIRERVAEAQRAERRLGPRLKQIERDYLGGFLRRAKRRLAD